jgi:MFS family permease
MVTVVQATVTDNERARVMALWFMAFGGTVPLGNILFGPVIDAIGARWVLLGGAVFALVLAWWTDLPRLTRAGRSASEQPRGDVLESGDAASFDEHGVIAGE